MLAVGRYEQGALHWPAPRPHYCRPANSAHPIGRSVSRQPAGQPVMTFRSQTCRAAVCTAPPLMLFCPMYCPMYCLYRLQYHELDTVEVAIPALNRLLKSPEFWGELSAAGVTRTLFFQTDSLLVHGGIQPFMQVGVFSKRELRGVVCCGGGGHPALMQVGC